MKSILIAFIFLVSVCASQSQVKPPSVFGPAPSPSQITWQKLEYSAFLHFSMNTFTDKEWGYGDEPESLFMPSAFEAESMVRTLKDAGMKSVILTCKHHDGFCLWPTATTEHSVKKSPWRNGKGDVVKEISDACRKLGLGFGVYLSPWDRNNSEYGKPEYINIYRKQLTELLSNYGTISEVWFDGANGGDGYYGGARETRTIDRATYYQWNETWGLVKKLQPQSVIFSDGGPDVRWVGDEEGYAGETNWSLLRRDEVFPGYEKYKELISGHADGTHWVPAECDVSIRPGWFYHPKDDTLVKPPLTLYNLYFQSVGRNASLLLNIPPDRRGRIHPQDSSALMSFKKMRDETFKVDYARKGRARASHVRGNDPRFAAANVNDGNPETYWSTDEGVTTGSVVLELDSQATVSCVLLQEYTPLGQRVEKFSIDAWNGSAWTAVDTGTTIGYKRLLRFPPRPVSKIRLTIVQSRACPAISTFSVYKDAYPPTQDFFHESKSQRDARMSWWREARFGMFIHWGLYSIPAGEWKKETNHAEWIRTTAQIPLAEYDKLTEKFNPKKFNPREWVLAAKNAGMKYITITTKHHDGFCLFDTKESEFDVMSTPFRRDIMKELSDACRTEGIKMCWYHSIMDWHHPDYLPRREWEKDRPAAGADMRKYVDHLKRQLEELLTNYGEISVLWFDGEWESTWNNEYGRELYAYVRSLRPNIIINNRVGVGREGLAGFTQGESIGDFGTPEQEIPATGLPDVDWETCMTMNDHWGYNKHDANFKSAKELLRILADVASKGGNLLLNVGPTAEGLFPAESAERLREIGEWMGRNGEAIYATGASPFARLEWGRCTMKEISAGTRLYLHVFDWPAGGELVVPGIFNEALRAYLLSDPSQKSLAVRRREDALVVAVPAASPDPYNSVVVLEVKGKADVSAPPRILAEFPIFVDSLSVDLTSEREHVEIRYTLDHSEPSASSDLALGPIRLAGTTDISARAYRNGAPVSEAAKAHFEKVPPREGILVKNPAPGIGYRYYEGEWDSLPAFGKLSPVSSGILDSITFSPRRQEEHFGFLYEGFINVERTGVYEFSTDSDDGSRMYIGDTLIVDNDGLHGMAEKKGAIALSRGYHPVKIVYFEKTGGDDLKVYIRFQGGSKIRLPAAMVFH